MLIWIFQTGEPLHCDSGNPRPMRAMNLASKLASQGHEVVIWSSAFYHQEKTHRSRTFSTVNISEHITIHLIPSMGYVRNIGLLRLIDHAELAFRLNRLLSKYSGKLPDLAFIGFPPIESAFVMTRWLKIRSIPTILDIKDQWPQIFVDKFPRILRPIARLIFSPYFTLSKLTFLNSTVICSMSESFLGWASLFAGRKIAPQDMVVPLVAPNTSVSTSELDLARRWWNDKGVNNSIKYRFTFIGSISPAFDFRPIRYLAQRLFDEKIDCQIVICGHGSESEVISKMMSGLPNVIMPGWIDQPKINILYSLSTAALAPYVNISNFMDNIPNKVIDCFSFSLPLITSLDGEVKALINTYNVGIHYSNNEELFNAARVLISDCCFRDELSKNSHNLYLNKFDFDIVYDRLTENIKKISCNHG